ncbi:MAG: hypothetical protein ACOC5T_08435 [Elusimicrobiota bacterium]
MANTIFIGVDPGNYGGISIIDGEKILVYDIPILKKKTAKKIRTFYDSVGIVNILKKYKKCKEVVFALERVSYRPGEGGVSAFNFGTGYGILQGIAVALGFKIKLVSPRTWKAFFGDQLYGKKVDSLKRENKDIKNNVKKIDNEIERLKSINRKEKDKTIKNMNKNTISDLESKKKEFNKTIEKNNRKKKAISKDSARYLAMKFLPHLKDRFKLKKNDGVAESYLIALYMSDIYDGS